MGTVFAIAHRGASAYAPENTVAAFDEALRLGCCAIEFDVHLAADGVPVVIHDDTLDRTTSGKGRVDAMSRLDLTRLDAGSWFHPRFAGTRIPTLDEALIAIAGGGATPVLELKAPIPPPLLAATLTRHGLLDDAVIISFRHDLLHALRMHSGRFALGLLAEEWTPRTLQDAKTVGAEVLSLSTTCLSPSRIGAAQDAGLEVWAFTANDVGLVAACAALGVTGITTDRPDLIRAKTAG